MPLSTIRHRTHACITATLRKITKIKCFQKPNPVRSKSTPDVNGKGGDAITPNPHNIQIMDDDDRTAVNNNDADNYGHSAPDASTNTAVAVADDSNPPEVVTTKSSYTGEAVVLSPPEVVTAESTDTKTGVDEDEWCVVTSAHV